MFLPALLLSLASAASAQGDFFKSRTYIHPGLPGPWVKPTRGEVWPKPHSLKENAGRFSVVDPTEFEFQVGDESDEKFILITISQKFLSLLGYIRGAP